MLQPHLLASRPSLANCGGQWHHALGGAGLNTLHLYENTTPSPPPPPPPLSSSPPSSSSVNHWQLFCPPISQVIPRSFRILSVCAQCHCAPPFRHHLIVVLDPPRIADLASAIERAQGFRSSAVAAASACTQRSARVLASSTSGCELSFAASTS